VKSFSFLFSFFLIGRINTLNVSITQESHEAMDAYMTKGSSMELGKGIKLCLQGGNSVFKDSYCLGLFRILFCDRMSNKILYLENFCYSPKPRTNVPHVLCPESPLPS
jgi:hypothetical protein